MSPELSLKLAAAVDGMAAFPKSVQKVLKLTRGASYADYQGFIDADARSILRAMPGIDELIADTSYTQAQYPAKKKLGPWHLRRHPRLRQSGAKMLFCTHHETARSDDALEAAFRQAVFDNPDAPHAGGPEIRLARGETYDF